MRLCAIIPTYRHVAALPALVEALRPLCVAVFVVDDGNQPPERDAIAALHKPGDGVFVIRLDANGGKGVAMLAGLREAAAQNFTHALQIDADGQHDVADAPKFIEAARRNPRALVCGQALFDKTAPSARKIGRYITHFWVWVETFSFDIADSMCGYRLYPLDATAAVMHTAQIGARMDFDTEIAVHLHWHGVPVINIPTRVIYPPDNVSNFRVLTDNLRISWMHTRLALQAPFRVAWKQFAPRPKRAHG
jgi:glycosyltransferase involved in cell wall biosynthesis